VDTSLLGRSILGHCLRTLRDGVLGQLSGEEETDSSLDFPRRDGGSLVVVGETGSLSSDTLKDVVDERVHDGHGLSGDASVGVNLLEHLVDVDSVALLPALLPLLVSLGDVLLGLAGLLRCLARGFGCHDDASCRIHEK